jgi:hypothetical protein
LLLSADPSYAPNTVKGMLLRTTTPGPVGDPFVDGHGILNTAAVGSALVTLNQSVPIVIT